MQVNDESLILDDQYEYSPEGTRNIDNLDLSKLRSY